MKKYAKERFTLRREPRGDAGSIAFLLAMTRSIGAAGKFGQFVLAIGG
jgi:hypothetical protein